MSVNIEGYVSQTGAASGWYQNGRAVSAQEKEKDAPQPKADNAVKVSISREGIESYWKQTREKGISGRVVAKGNKESVIRQAKQAASALIANAYGGELAGELEKLKGQSTGGTYGIADEMEDSVRAYANLYDEIVQGYQDGTRERYVEDENSETGFRKMTMEEELSRLDRAFQKMADRADAREMIEGEFKRLRTEGGKGLSTNASKKPQGTDGDAPETAGQKMKRLAQAWAGNGFPPPATRHHIFSVHTAVPSKGAAGFFYSTHFYFIPGHITKEYMIFITGVPGIFQVRFFCALMRLPYRVRAPPLRS